MRRKSNMFNTKQIRVVGVGGVGCSTVNCLISAGLQDIQFIAVDIDNQVLANSKAPIKITGDQQLIQPLDKWEAAAEAVHEAKNDIIDALIGARFLFILAGLGGGTGTGAAPAIAKIAKELNICTVAVVTGPEGAEGYGPILNAKNAIKELEQCVDSLMVLPTDHMMTLSHRQIASSEAHQTFANLLCQSFQVIYGFLSQKGLLNLDLADLRSIISNKGVTLTTFGHAQGNDRARIAAENALFCQKLGLSIHGARGLLVNIRASGSLNLFETQTIAKIIKNSTYLGADLVLGIDIDETLGDEIWVYVIATGFINENWEIGTDYEQPLPDKQPIIAPQRQSEEADSTIFTSPNDNRFRGLSLRRFPIPAFMQC